MEFVVGFVAGFILAGAIGRSKFLQVKNTLRTVRDELKHRLNDLYIERNLNDGLSQELADRTR